MNRKLHLKNTKKKNKTKPCSLIKCHLLWNLKAPSTGNCGKASPLYRTGDHGRVNTSASKNGKLVKAVSAQGRGKSWRAWMDLTQSSLEEKNLEDFEETPPHSVVQCPLIANHCHSESRKKPVDSWALARPVAGNETG